MAVLTDYSYLGLANGWGTVALWDAFRDWRRIGGSLYAEVHHSCCPPRRSRASHDDGERFEGRYRQGRN